MGLLLANGRKVFGGTISFPLSGAWVADLVVDNPDGITGACEIVADGGVTLRGTVARGGVWIESARLRVVAGAAGLGHVARAQHYRTTRIRTVLGDLLRTSGDKLATSASAAILDKSLDAYTLMAMPVGTAIAALLGDPRTTGASWRMLPDGTLWVGAETWPDSGLAAPATFIELDERLEESHIELGVDTVALLPGTKLAGRKVGRVEYTIAAGALRAAVAIED